MSMAPVFRYEGYDLDSISGTLTCHYSLGSWLFEDRITFLMDASSWRDSAVHEAARLVFLLTGFVYYEIGMPSVVDLGDTRITAPERELLRRLYENSFIKYARQNHLAIPKIRIISQDSPPRVTSLSAESLAPVRTTQPLVPFETGVNSIVAAEILRQSAEPSIFILGRGSERLKAIERSARTSGLPILRAEREIDQGARGAKGAWQHAADSSDGGALSAIAVMAAILGDCDSVAMPYGWRTSLGTVESDTWSIGKQYSKSAGFEMGFRRVLADSFGARIRYFSILRPFSDLWIARRFADLSQYHPTFLTCNRALALDELPILDHWCTQCDACCLTNLSLAPFLERSELQEIFGGKEPFAGCDTQSKIARQFEALLGLSLGPGAEVDPIEIGVRRASLALASRRTDRADDKSLQALAARLPSLSDDLATAALLLQPIGGHFIPDEYSPDDFE